MAVKQQLTTAVTDYFNGHHWRKNDMIDLLNSAVKEIEKLEGIVGDMESENDSLLDDTLEIANY